MNHNALIQVSLKIILRNKKGETLLLKVSEEDKSIPDYHDFPGGRIHQSEMNMPLAKAFAREVGEELGNKVKYELKEVPVAIGRHCYFSKKYKADKYVFWILFEGAYKSGEIRLSEEHVEYKWVKLTKANFRRYFTNRGGYEVAENYFLKKFSKLRIRPIRRVI